MLNGGVGNGRDLGLGTLRGAGGGGQRSMIYQRQLPHAVCDGVCV